MVYLDTDDGTITRVYGQDWSVMFETKGETPYRFIFGSGEDRVFIVRQDGGYKALNGDGSDALVGTHRYVKPWKYGNEWAFEVIREGDKLRTLVNAQGEPVV